MASAMPFVSVITSTCNRARFIPRLIEMYRQQTYPHEDMEWLILDDGEEPIEHYFKPQKIRLPNIRYIHLSHKLTMGKKLNLLTNEAKGEIIVVMDDDDYYPPSRVEEAVNALEANPTVNVAGCSFVYLYFTDSNSICSTGPYHDKHALNCSMAFRKSYCKNHRYDDAETCAVERLFLDDYTEPMIQLDSEKTLLHIIHSTNTFNAMKARKNGTLGLCLPTKRKLESFISEKEVRLAFVDAY